MPQHYSNPARESEPHALPDVEVFFLSDAMRGADTLASHAAGIPPSWEHYPVGWYWWACFPGCLPDSDPVGPFDSESEALADAREGCDDDAPDLSCDQCNATMIQGVYCHERGCPNARKVKVDGRWIAHEAGEDD